MYITRILLLTLLVGCSNAGEAALPPSGLNEMSEETPSSSPDTRLQQDPSEACTCVGEPGPVGPSGADGLPGTDGERGPVGATGATGERGPAGERGEAGPAGSVGATGARGSDGADGIDGRDGVDGIVNPAMLYVTSGGGFLPSGNHQRWALCDAGDFVISGGCTVQGQSNGGLAQSVPMPPVGEQWSTTGYNGVGWLCTFSLFSSVTATVIAVCVDVTP